MPKMYKTLRQHVKVNIVSTGYILAISITAFFTSQMHFTSDLKIRANLKNTNAMQRI